MLSAEEILYKVAKLLNEDTQVSREEVVEKTDDVYEDIVSQGLNKKSSNSRQEEADDELDDEDGLEDKEDEDEEEFLTKDESPSTINLTHALDYEKFIDLLNQFRAAHSFTSEDMTRELTDYFNRLEKEEKQVLHILFKGLTQITLMDVRGKSAYIPSDLKFDINKLGSSKSEKNRSKNKEKIVKASQADNIDSKKKSNRYSVNNPIKIGN